jgi:hypothetical protein
MSVARIYTDEESADAQRDVLALIGAQARRDEEAAAAILDHGDPVLIAMVLAGVVKALLEDAGEDPAGWAAQRSAILAERL